MTSSPPAESPVPAARPTAPKAFDWPNLRLRLISAAVLVPVALGGVAAGGALYLLLLSVAVVLLASEWAKMCAPVAVSRTAALVAAAVLASLLLAYASRVSVGWAALPLGAVLAAIVGRIAGWTPRSPDVGFGVLYLGAPSLALLWVRDNDAGGLFGHPIHAPIGGLDWTVLLLISTWAADIGAFAGGSLFKGSKLWPRISPNKTWSGFGSGLLAAALAAGLLWWILHSPGWLSLPTTVGIGIGAGLATMGGDLLESMLKRRFGVKDSGDLIPGHGGLLDRVDGMMAAALAVAGARLLAEAGMIA